MKKSRWPGIMKILELQHIRNGKVIYEEKNILNTMHIDGELFILSCMFDGGTIPENYFIGLDDRADIELGDTIDDINDEPVSNGYLRQPVSSTGGFTVEIVNNIYRATGEIVTFTATGSGWGPVQNIFMVTSENDSGVLLASNKLSSTLTTVAGDSITMRMALTLRDGD